jgi:hypothetical protein
VGKIVKVERGGLVEERRVPPDQDAFGGIGFGDRAARWAARLRCALPVIVCEPAQAVAALGAALELRRAGHRFLASIYFEEPRTVAFARESRERMTYADTLDELRVLLDAFAVESLASAARTITPAADLAAVGDLMRLAHGLLFRSWTEHARLREAIGVIPREAEVLVLDDPLVPAVTRQPPSDVVVWAPDERATTLGGFITALQDLALPVTVVAADAGVNDGGALRFVGRDHAAAALARARVVVDATRNDPGTACALTRLGLPLAVSADGGAAERLDGALTFEPWSRRSILAAAADALGAAPTTLRSPSPQARLPLPPEPCTESNAPLVSIVIATRDRPAMLDATLATIDRQSYPAIEVVVVNDAGTDPSAVVARHRGARLLATETNLGPGGARNVGLRDSRGEYVLFFDDDDEMFPDHVASLVDVAERSGLDVAYGQMLNCYLIPAGAGRYVLDAIQTYEALLDHADIQWGASIAVTAVLFRRSIVSAVGEVDETLPTASDYDYWIRLAEQREWVRVPYVTSIYNWRSDASNISGRAKSTFHAGHEQIYAKHPTTRALVTAGRWEMLDTLARGIGDGPR